ncbi:Transcription factor IIIA [Linum grandiflorum]
MADSKSSSLHKSFLPSEPVHSSQSSSQRNPSSSSSSSCSPTDMEAELREEAMEKEMEEPHVSTDTATTSAPRRYLCKYCGVSRSKKYLISSHILSHHKDEMSEEEDEGEETEKSNTCEECGACFRKPAYLREHMRSHSLERPFKCSVEGCHASYRRKDHLNRHLLQHKENVFKCPVESCTRKFLSQDDVDEHFQELHYKPAEAEDEKQYVCDEPGCGKMFPYPSKLQKHLDSHGKSLSFLKLESIEAVCLEPGCGKHFSNEQCLKAHIQASHQYINCEICGKKQLKKNIKRHLQSHKAGGEPTQRVSCDHDGCGLTFATKTNLNKHVKAVHLEAKPFACGFPRCGMRFSYKHVRDNHEKSGCHVYTCGDFVDSDEQFRSRPRGGMKRTCPSVETLLTRKRVSLPPDTENCC